MTRRNFDTRGNLISNLAVLIFIAAALNWAAAEVIGRPILYCALSDSVLVREAMGFYHLGLVFLMPIGVVAIAKGNREGFGLVVGALLFAALPAFFDTLFNIPPGCDGA